MGEKERESGMEEGRCERVSKRAGEREARRAVVGEGKRDKQRKI